MPIGAPSHSVPKSGCRVSSRPIESMKASLLGCSGYSEMSVFQGLSLGNMLQPARLGLLPEPVVEVSVPAAAVEEPPEPADPPEPLDPPEAFELPEPPEPPEP